mmetsp:Transcript_1059/g.2256  ORF Transcript_1059/g.2256 Transcript_1059/m.2256 type:complete len:201 (-) Transcript_1059:1042-1644(-)
MNHRLGEDTKSHFLIFIGIAVSIGLQENTYIYCYAVCLRAFVPTVNDLLHLNCIGRASGHRFTILVFINLLASQRKILAITLGVSQSVKKIQVLRRLLGQLARRRERLHNGLAGAAFQSLSHHSCCSIGDTNITIATSDGTVVGLLLFLLAIVPVSSPTDGSQQPSVPLVHNLHRDHGTSQAELNRLGRREFKRSSEVEV